MSSDGTQENPYVIVGGGEIRSRDLIAIIEQIRAEGRQPNFEEILALHYGLTPEQVTQLVETVRRAAEVWGLAFQEVVDAVQKILAGLRNNPDIQLLLGQQKHKCERPRLPSQQGYNRTLYDRWRNNLGKGRGKRKL